MLSQKQQTSLELYCNVFVLDMFADMLNKQNRGENFTWEEFPNTVASLAAANVFTMHTQERTLNEAKREAYGTCLYIARYTLRRAGYIT